MLHLRRRRVGEDVLPVRAMLLTTDNSKLIKGAAGRSLRQKFKDTALALQLITRKHTQFQFKLIQTQSNGDPRRN